MKRPYLEAIGVAVLLTIYYICGLYVIGLLDHGIKGFFGVGK